jgi:replicative DNA helicase
VTPSFVSGADLLGTWWADVTTGPPPVRYRLPAPFDSLDARPGRLILFGGAPGSGKTAALLQLGVDLLRLNPTARLLIANVEMPPVLLLERIVARLASVPLSAITDRSLTPVQRARVEVALAALEPTAERLAFLHAPFSLEHVAAAGTAFEANVLVLDYLQRFTVGDSSTDARERLELLVPTLRRFCDATALVLTAAAVARQRDTRGSTYRGLNLASFRGSSELEYNADAAYLLTSPRAGAVEFACVKNRYQMPTDLVTTFDPTTQTFRPAPVGLNGFDEAAPAGEND